MSKGNPGPKKGDIERKERVGLLPGLKILMPKSTITLANGTSIIIEGSTEEVAALINLYGGGNEVANPKKGRAVSSNVASGQLEKETYGAEKVDLLLLVAATKDDNDFDKIESQILDKASQVDRVLLPLFVADRTFTNPPALSSNDIYNFLKQFGINMALPNVSKTLTTTAVKYVMPTALKKKGAANSYRLSRKGKQYIEQVLSR